MIKLVLGDCLDEMKKIPTGSIDAIICDLPYGTTECKWDIMIPLDRLWKEYNRIIKENGVVVLFGCQPFTSLLGASNIENLRYSWVWEKTKPTNFMHAKKKPLRAFEDILVFYKKQPTYNPQGLVPVNKVLKNSVTKAHGFKMNGDKTSLHKGFKNNFHVQTFTNYPRGFIVTGENGMRNSFHPTQKPVSVLEYLIKTYTNEGDVILDNCMGSGSTGLAAVNLNRHFIGIEKEKRYYEIAKKRILPNLGKIGVVA